MIIKASFFNQRLSVKLLFSLPEFSFDYSELNKIKIKGEFQRPVNALIYC